MGTSKSTSTDFSKDRSIKPTLEFFKIFNLLIYKGPHIYLEVLELIAQRNKEYFMLVRINLGHFSFWGTERLLIQHI